MEYWGVYRSINSIGAHNHRRYAPAPSAISGGTMNYKDCSKKGAKAP